MTGFGPRIIYVWMVLVPLFWLVCVIDGWRETATRSERIRLVVSQVLHWFAVIAAMYVALQPEVRGVVNDNATGLLMLTLLTLGTFLAGVRAWSPAICIVSVASGRRSRPSAWLEQSVLLLVTGLVVLLLVLISWVVWRVSADPPRPPERRSGQTRGGSKGHRPLAGSGAVSPEIRFGSHRRVRG